MATSRVASRYIKSLLELAVQEKALDAVHADMQLFAAACRKSNDLALMLKSPVIPHETKRVILEKLLKGKVHKLTLSIVDILTRKNREPLLPEIAREFHHAYNTHKGIGRASVATPVAMDAPTRKKIEDIAKKLSETSTVELEEKVDKDLIGGFVLNVGDRQIDASIKSKLKVLKVKFSENPYVKEF
jgi:F-type H+-transporting ATPase subunit delta